MRDAQHAQPGAITSAAEGVVPSYQSVPVTRNPEEIYGNAVVTPDELPKASRPLYFLPVKIGLLLLSLVCLGGGIASIIWGAKVEKNQGGLLPGMREIPFKTSTAAVFIGSFTAAVSLVLLGIASRNWYPSLVTFSLFVSWILFGDLAMNSMMSPMSLNVHDRVLNWARMPSSTHILIYQAYQCCGYDNMSTCDYTAVKPALATSISSSTTKLAKRSLSDGPDSSPTLQVTPPSVVELNADQTSPLPTPFRLRRRAAEPLIHGSETIAQNGPGVPLPTEAVVVIPPSPLPESTTNGASVSISLAACQTKVDPLIDSELNSVRKYYLVAAALSAAQLVFLTGFWALLGKWKSVRGLKRW